MGRADEAERLLAGRLADVVEASRAASRCRPWLVDVAARFAAKLATATAKGAWADYVIELYHAQARPCPGAGRRRAQQRVPQGQRDRSGPPARVPGGPAREAGDVRSGGAVSASADRGARAARCASLTGRRVARRGSRRPLPGQVRGRGARDDPAAVGVVRRWRGRGPAPRAARAHRAATARREPRALGRALSTAGTAPTRKRSSRAVDAALAQARADLLGQKRQLVRPYAARHAQEQDPASSEIGRAPARRCGRRPRPARAPPGSAPARGRSGSRRRAARMARSGSGASSGCRDGGS